MRHQAMRPKKRQVAIRDNRGMSLAAVMALGLVTTMMVSALMQSVMPVFRNVSGLNNETQLRGLAEIGADYAIAQMNSGADGWDLSGTPGANMAKGTKITKSLPSSIIGKGNVTVEISSPGNPSAPNNNGVGGSMLYDPLLDNSFQNSYRMLTITAQYGSGQKQIRALLQPIIGTMNGGNNGNGNNGGLQDKYPYGLFGIASVIYAGQAAFNSYNAPASKPLAVQTGADGGTLGKISQVYGGGGLTRSIAQGGAHYEFPNPVSVYNQQFKITAQTYNAKPAVSAPWMNMYGNVYSNGVNTAYYPLTGPGDPNNASVAHNVFGSNNGIDAGVWNPNSGSVNAPDALIPVPSPPAWTGGKVGFNQVGAQGYTYPQPPMPNAITAPAGTVDLGPVTIKNGSQLIIDSSAPVPTAPLGVIGANGPQTVKIPPGNYKMSSLTLSKGNGSSGSSINILTSTQGQIASGAQPPAKFYLEGSTTPSTAMSVDNYSSINMNGVSGTGLNFNGRTGLNNKNATASNQIAINHPNDSAVQGSNIAETSGSASQLQIFSNYGSGTQFILQGNERMIFNNPYANVTVGSILSNGAPKSITNSANYYGAILATNIYVQSSYSSGGGAFVHYDYKLHPDGVISPFNPPSPYLPASPQVVTGYRAVSWQESVQTPNGMSWAYSYQ